MSESVEITPERRLAILKSLGSITCESCEGKKQPRMSHCRKCYFGLHPDTRHALYRKFGNGYEEAFERSLAELKAKAEAKAK